MKLDLDRMRVVSVRQDFQVRIEFEPHATVAIEQSILISMPGGSTYEIGHGAEGYADPRLDELIGATVDRAWVDDGVLHVVFTDARELVVPPSDEYEAWDVDTPGRDPAKVVSVPGGELAVW